MPRIPRVRGLMSLPLSTCSARPASRTPLLVARGISSTDRVYAIRDKLWKGENPLPEDPYTQRAEPEDPSNLPDEAVQARTPQDRIPQAVRDSRLVLPPRRTEAALEKELAANDPTYVPAETLEDLEEISPLKTWWDQPGHWGEESEFRGFAKPGKVVDPAVIEVYLRRAVVEVLALQQAGKLSEWATKKWAEGSQGDMDATLALQIEANDGQASLKGDAVSVANQITSEADEVHAPERISAEEASEITKTWDPSWKDITLNDESRFALRKRLFQLTGNLVSDAKVGATHNVGQFLTVAIRQPQPKKLIEVLQNHDGLKGLPNVKLHDRKQTPIDKETAVGRWKVIEEELTKRGLPVTGHDGLPGHKERRWIRGEI